MLSFLTCFNVPNIVSVNKVSAQLFAALFLVLCLT